MEHTATAMALRPLVDWKAASWLSMILTYSYLDSEFTIENDYEVQELNGLFSAASPKHQASLRSSIDFSENIRGQSMAALC